MLPWAPVGLKITTRHSHWLLGLAAQEAMTARLLASIFDEMAAGSATGTDVVWIALIVTVFTS